MKVSFSFSSLSSSSSAEWLSDVLPAQAGSRSRKLTVARTLMLTLSVAFALGMTVTTPSLLADEAATKKAKIEAETDTDTDTEPPVVLCTLQKTKEPITEDGVLIYKDIWYKTKCTEGVEPEEYEKERCLSDIYIPAGKKNFPLVVWFHGGGLTAGDKSKDGTPEVARFWAKQGIGVVVSNYRLSPKVTYPTYLQDGASAIAWARDNVPGADPARLFVGGHSAGAYMALMIGMDKKLQEEAGLKREDIAGLIPVSGQTMTHFTVRQERGLPKDRAIADEAAPVYLAAKNMLPTLLLVGDQDMKTRWEENAYFASQCRALGAEHVQLLMIKGRNHGSIFGKLNSADDLGYQAIKSFIMNPLSVNP